MDAKEYKAWLKSTPSAVLNCKICGKHLGISLVTNGQDYHPRCLNLKAAKRRAEMAVHSDDPYTHTLKRFK